MTSSRIMLSLLAGFAVAAGIASFAISWRPAIAEIDPPRASTFDPALVKRGRDLASMRNCNDYHETRGGKPFAGGLRVPTPFGNICSANITPDPDTGIGRWSEAAFGRAKQTGVNRAGQHRHPTFHYDYFTNVSADENRALYVIGFVNRVVDSEHLLDETTAHAD